MQLLHARSGNAVVFDDFIGKGRRRCTTSAARKADAKGLTMPQLFPNDCDAIFRGVPVEQLSILFQSCPAHLPQLQGGRTGSDKIATLAKFVADDALDGLAAGILQLSSLSRARRSSGSTQMQRAQAGSQVAVPISAATERRASIIRCMCLRPLWCNVIATGGLAYRGVGRCLQAERHTFVPDFTL